MKNVRECIKLLDKKLFSEIPFFVPVMPLGVKIRAKEIQADHWLYATDLKVSGHWLALFLMVLSVPNLIYPEFTPESRNIEIG
jgi:hypothetical protein